MIAIRIFIITGIYLLLYSNGYCQNSSDKTDIDNLRLNITDAFINEKTSKRLMDKFKSATDTSNLFKGYLGGVYISWSKHAPFYDKMSSFNKGSKLLDNAIIKDPENVELLFLRLTIQHNAPSMLGYTKNISEDKRTVLKNYRQAPPVIVNRIKDYVVTSDKFSPEEKKLIKNQ